MAEKGSKNKESAKTPPLWEWIIAAVGFVLVTSAVGLMIYRAATEGNSPPKFSFSVEEIVATGDGYHVKFRVANRGDQTAAAVNIEGELKKGHESIEKSSATLTYAPPHSEREGGLLFTKNPNEFELSIRALGYEKP